MEQKLKTIKVTPKTIKNLNAVVKVTGMKQYVVTEAASEKLLVATKKKKQ